MSEPVGYVVLTKTYGRWQADWDGEVHSRAEDGREALADARTDGQTAILVALHPVDEAEAKS